MHAITGGAWTDEPLGHTYDFQHTALRVVLFKIMWRSGVTRCPTECSPGEECQCAIPDDLFERYSPSELLDKAFLRSTLGN